MLYRCANQEETAPSCLWVLVNRYAQLSGLQPQRPAAPTTCHKGSHGDSRREGSKTAAGVCMCVVKHYSIYWRGVSGEIYHRQRQWLSMPIGLCALCCTRSLIRVWVAKWVAKWVVFCITLFVRFVLQEQQVGWSTRVCEDSVLLTAAPAAPQQHHSRSNTA